MQLSYLASFICLKIMVQFFVQPFMVVNASNAVHALLADLLSASKNKKEHLAIVHSSACHLMVFKVCS